VPNKSDYHSNPIYSPYSHVTIYRIFSSRSGGFEQFCLGESNAVYSVESKQTFRRNVSPPCSGSKTKPRAACHLISRLFLAWLILLLWSRGRHVSPKRWLTFNGLHDVTSQRTEVFTPITIGLSLLLSICPIWHRTEQTGNVEVLHFYQQAVYLIPQLALGAFVYSKLFSIFILIKLYYTFILPTLISILILFMLKNCLKLQIDHVMLISLCFKRRHSRCSTFSHSGDKVGTWNARYKEKKFNFKRGKMYRSTETEGVCLQSTASQRA
jgi:hypothetical protein